MVINTWEADCKTSKIHRHSTRTFSVGSGYKQKPWYVAVNSIRASTVSFTVDALKSRLVALLEVPHPAV